MTNTTFKNFYTKESIHQLGKRCQSEYQEFKINEFVKVASKGIEALEMKERIDRISQALYKYLPEDYNQAIDILQRAMLAKVKGAAMQGFEVWPLCQFVEDYGIEHFDRSINALYEMTKLFTSEVPIRKFLVSDVERVMPYLKKWVFDEDKNVRRLVSEGLRPRLPWAQRLYLFIEDPQPVVELLEHLKDDPELYVRRSVANCLNDISKDHPDIVINTVKRWSKSSDKNMEKLIKHGCRTLIKQGHPDVFPLLGYTEKPSIKVGSFDIDNKNIRLGQDMLIESSISSTAKDDQKIVVDYKIYHKKANGDVSPKVFKWTTFTILGKGKIQIKKTHKFRPVTTRKYYSGEHHIGILVNGIEKAKIDFNLTV